MNIEKDFAKPIHGTKERPLTVQYLNSLPANKIRAMIPSTWRPFCPPMSILRESNYVFYMLDDMYWDVKTNWFADD